MIYPRATGSSVSMESVSWRKDAVVRTSTQQRIMGPLDPRLNSPAEREKSAAKDGGTGGQYIAVFIQSPTHLSHTTLSQPFRIKCERYIFLKKCVRSSLLLILFPHAYVYVTFVKKKFVIFWRTISLKKIIAVSKVDRFENNSLSTALFSTLSHLLLKFYFLLVTLAMCVPV